MVAADAATHTATLTAGEEGAGAGEAEVTAWFRLDPQNNTLDWTIDIGDFNPATIYIFCGEPPPEGEAPALELVDNRGIGSAVEGTIAPSEEVFTQIQEGECTVAAETGGEPATMIQGPIEPAETGAPADGAPAAPAGGAGAGGM